MQFGNAAEEENLGWDDGRGRFKGREFTLYLLMKQMQLWTSIVGLEVHVEVFPTYCKVRL